MSGKYNAARSAFGEATLSWTRDRIVAQLVSAEYRFSEAHVDARALKGTIGEPVELTGKSIKDGRARAQDALVFPRVTGPDVAALVLYRAPPAGSAQAATLIVHLDDIEHFPMKTNGGDIVIDAPKAGFFRL